MNAKHMTADLESNGRTEGGEEQDPSNRDGGSGKGGGGGIEPAVGSRALLGLDRWVQYVFVVVAAFLLWFLDKVATLIWQNFAEPPTVAITATAAVISVAATIALYRNERTQTLVTDVVAELSKVTWPSRKETYASTLVVIVTSLIAAGVVGAFDFVWSFFTDLLYKHKV
jgi:preprotein translocase subunit SecE